MDEPKAWRDLAERFTQLHAGGPDRLTASWRSSAWNDSGDHWLISGVDDQSFYKLFMWAVERAAVLLGHTANPLFFWLDLLKQESPRYSGGGTSETIVGDQVSKAETGTISTLCLASAEYCYRLETQAIAKDRNKWGTVVGSIGEQLEQLRQECNWSIEKLAEAVKIDPTNVSRHLSNKSVPYPRNLAKYIHVLSKELKRHIVISKTQPRRS